MVDGIDLTGKRVITVTELGSYRRCRLLWDLHYNQNLVPISEAPRFFVGRLVHRCLEKWADNYPEPMGKAFAQSIAEERDKMIERYKETIGANISAVELNLWLEKAALPMDMVLNYERFWKTPLPDGYRMISTEQTCMVEIPGVSDVILEGTLDGLVIDEKTGYLYVKENKTYDARPSLDTLENADQFVGYCWIVRQLYPDYHIGGILYDGLWKRTTTAKRTIEELFMRHHLIKSDFEIDMWGENLQRMAREIAAGPEIYPNRVWQGCWDDKAYGELCSAMMKGEDAESIRLNDYEQRETPWWFDTEESE